MSRGSQPELDEVLELLRQHGAVLVRSKKHRVFRFPDGRIFSMSHTPSDVRAGRQYLRDLKHLLGLSGNKTTVGERRERRHRQKNRRESWTSPAVGVDLLAGKRIASIEELRAVAANRIHLVDSPPRQNILTITRTPLTTLLRRLLG